MLHCIAGGRGPPPPPPSLPRPPNRLVSGPRCSTTGSPSTSTTAALTWHTCPPQRPALLDDWLTFDIHDCCTDVAYMPLLMLSPLLFKETVTLVVRWQRCMCVRSRTCAMPPSSQ